MVLRFDSISWTLLWLSSTQSTFLKFFRCSRFCEFDSNLLTNEEKICNSLYAVYKDLGINAGHVKIICEIEIIAKVQPPKEMEINTHSSTWTKNKEINFRLKKTFQYNKMPLTSYENLSKGKHCLLSSKGI